MTRSDVDGVKVCFRRGVKVLEVDTAKVVFKGIKWRHLSEWGKKKFENYIFLKNTEGRDQIKVCYST